ncbi:MAG: M15 family metallopeptidase [Cryobacterium sp.]|nr:M15 family metallopeptidase [Oligoflexia bacterium]
MSSKIHDKIYDLVDLDHYPFRLDIRYATENNFMGKVLYPYEKAFLQEPVAEDLAAAHDELTKHGYGILVFDGYRPWIITKIFWDWANEDQRKFLANPDNGSIHNRGCAVDCSLYDLKTGMEIEMPSKFDTMNETAWSTFDGGSEESRRLRDLLIHSLSKHRFQVLKHEWWHFSHASSSDYPVMNVSFPEILSELE